MPRVLTGTTVDVTQRRNRLDETPGAKHRT